MNVSYLAIRKQIDECLARYESEKKRAIKAYSKPGLDIGGREQQYRLIRAQAFTFKAKAEALKWVLGLREQEPARHFTELA